MSMILVFIARHDLRLGDHPVFNNIAKSLRHSHHPYTHLLPIYVVPAQQVEVSGLLVDGEKSPYPEARSGVAGFWRCGAHRAKFLAEAVWDFKESLEDVGSGLMIKAGRIGDVVDDVCNSYSQNNDQQIYQIWMTGEESSEEKDEESAVRRVCSKHGKELRLWTDEKYFIHDDDLPFQDIKQLPDVFTKFRNAVEPLREAPRSSLPRPHQLPPLPKKLPSGGKFVSPKNDQDFIGRLQRPLSANFSSKSETQAPSIQWPTGAETAHPFRGGEKAGHERVRHYIKSGSATSYKDTRNGLLGADFSTKFSAWLALGCLTSRQIHEYLVQFEDGSTDLGKGVHGYGKGENKGTGWIRFELLWRDYMRLCTRKFGTRLFRAGGFKGDNLYKWKRPGQDGDQVSQQVRRFLNGSTGIGLIDASQRELWLTGYTSNRARQNVASFLAKHLEIDWRIGAEWYEHCLADYDVSSNWGNWQYVAGVGNDPRDSSRIFNPVKQAFDYDPQGEYVKAWVEELRSAEQADGIFQAWKLPQEMKEKCKIAGSEMAENPLKKIDYRRGNKGSGDKHAHGGRGKGKPKGGKA